jgi:hypothetical protein
MNIHNLLTSAFSNAGLTESHYTVTFQRVDGIQHVTIQSNSNPNWKCVIEFTIESDNYCSDIFISQNNLFSARIHRLIFETLTGPEFIEF